MSTPQPCTSWSLSKQHLSVDLAPDLRKPGNVGKTLCAPGGIPADAYDDVAINAQLADWRKGKPPIVVADLPECKLCARKAAKLATA